MIAGSVLALEVLEALLDFLLVELLENRAGVVDARLEWLLEHSVDA